MTASEACYSRGGNSSAASSQGMSAVGALLRRYSKQKPP